MTFPGTKDDWRPWAAERGREVKTALAFLTRLPFVAAAAPADMEGAPPDAAQASSRRQAGRFHSPALRSARSAPSFTRWRTSSACRRGRRRRSPSPPRSPSPARCTKTGWLTPPTALAAGGRASKNSPSCATAGSALTASARFVVAPSARRFARKPRRSGAVAAALIAAHAAGRTVMPALMFFLAPARSDGLSIPPARHPRPNVAAGAVLALIFCCCVSASR